MGNHHEKSDRGVVKRVLSMTSVNAVFSGAKTQRTYTAVE